MSALSIQPTYPIFTETDGQPLENGYIWIGTVNLDPQVNPIAVYWDAALTQLAAQPIRTEGGYPVNNGTPARLYVNSDYSIRVMNKNGGVVYSAPASTERYGNIITACDISYDPQFVGAIPTTVCEKLDQIISVKDFGAVGDGLTDDTLAIQTALDQANKKTIYFPAGTYLVTSLEVDQQYTTIHADSAVLIGTATGTYTHILKLNTNLFTINGSLVFDGQFQTNYECAFWVKGGYGRYNNITFSRCKLAIRIGESGVNQVSLSEMFFSKCVTNRCRNALEMYGLFSVANFTDCILVGGEDSTWTGQDTTTIKNYGGRIFAENSSLYGNQDANYPIVYINQTLYEGLYYTGSIYLNTIDSEVYGKPFLQVWNASTTSQAPDSGTVSIVNSRIDFFLYALLSPQPDFFFFNNYYNGRFLTSSNRFKFFDPLTKRPIQLGALTQANIDLTDIDAGLSYYGTNAMTYPGLPPQVPFQTVLSVTMNSAFTAGSGGSAQPVVFDTIRTGINANRITLSDFYSNSTGVFTVPSGGLSSIVVIANYRVSGALGASPRCWIRHTSSSGGFTREYAYQPIVAAGGQVIANIAEAAEGDEITFQMYTDNAGAALDVGLNFNNQMTVSAYITTPNS